MGCFDRKLFGAPKYKMREINRIHSQTAIFLLNFAGPKIMHGVFVSNGKSGLHLVKEAWDGKFPAQIHVKRVANLSTKESSICREIYKDFLSEEKVKDIINVMKSSTKKAKKSNLERKKIENYKDRRIRNLENRVRRLRNRLNIF